MALTSHTSDTSDTEASKCLHVCSNLAKEMEYMQNVMERHGMDIEAISDCDSQYISNQGHYKYTLLFSALRWESCVYKIDTHRAVHSKFIF